MKDFFKNCTTLDQLKAEYRRLAKKHHPDVGGDTETMKEINRQYEAAFDRMNRRTAADGTSKQHTGETAADFIRVIDALIRLKGITVELCGSWLWISGDTRPVKDQLKEAGCRWASKKSMWYWRPADQAPVHRHRVASMDHIRSKYGSRIISGAGKRDCDLRTA